jgi:hypothetical protein
MSAYGSVKKDTVAYRSGTWVCMHDAWVLWEGHSMVHMLLTGHTDMAKRERSWLGVDRQGCQSSKGFGL